jgi:molybdopterin synthase sulfur carrier subunit
MAILVRIPTPLRRFTSGESVVKTEGATITEALARLDLQYPGIKKRLYDGKALRQFVNIYLNDEDIRFLNGEHTVVHDGDKISIVPAIAGGNAGRTDVSFQ